MEKLDQQRRNNAETTMRETVMLLMRLETRCRRWVVMDQDSGKVAKRTDGSAETLESSKAWTSFELRWETETEQDKLITLVGLSCVVC